MLVMRSPDSSAACQGRIKVFDEVGDVLKADRDPDETRVMPIASRASGGIDIDIRPTMTSHMQHCSDLRSWTRRSCAFTLQALTLAIQMDDAVQ